MTVKFKDYYETLGVARTADEKELRRAFRKLAAKWHPDVNKEPDAEARFKEINEAYEVLKDPKKRELYDRLGQNWKSGQDFTPPPGWQQTEFDHGGVDLGDYSDFFSQLFGGAFSGGRSPFGGRRARAPQRGQDFEVELALTLEEAAAGGKKAFQIERQELGADGVPRPRLVRYDVAIPEGVAEGTRIRLAGQGGAGPGGGSAGDLLLKVRLLPHPWFVVDGHDLKTVVQITPWEAGLGTEVAVPTPTGTTATLKIRPGSRSGERLRLRGLGLRRSGGDRGDLYVTLAITLPEALSEQEQALLQQWRDLSPFVPERLRKP